MGLGVVVIVSASYLDWEIPSSNLCCKVNLFYHSLFQYGVFKQGLWTGATLTDFPQKILLSCATCNLCRLLDHHIPFFSLKFTIESICLLLKYGSFLLSDGKTDELIGIPETLITSSICGCLFALFSGQPLVIIGRFCHKFLVYHRRLWLVSLGTTSNNLFTFVGSTSPVIKPLLHI